MHTSRAGLRCKRVCAGSMASRKGSAIADPAPRNKARRDNDRFVRNMAPIIPACSTPELSQPFCATPRSQHDCVLPDIPRLDAHELGPHVRVQIRHRARLLAPRIPNDRALRPTFAIYDSPIQCRIINHARRTCVHIYLIGFLHQANSAPSARLRRNPSVLSRYSVPSRPEIETCRISLTRKYVCSASSKSNGS